MFAKQQMNALAERRRLLAKESELHRTLIRLECKSLQKRFAGINAARERVKLGGPWLATGGTIAGLLAVRHWRKLARWAPAALTALRWVKALRSR